MKQLMVVLAAAAIVAGCNDKNTSTAEKKDDAVITITQDNRTYAELSTNDVLVRVNGADLTKGEVERQIAFRIALAKLRQGSKMDERREAQMRGEMLRSLDRQFIMQELMKAYALSNGVKVTESDRVPMRAQLVRMYAKGADYARLVSKLSKENKAILAEGVDREIWVKKGREKLTDAKRVPVSAEDVSNRRASLVKYNERALEALAKTWADATNVWKKATGGCPFEKLVEQYAEGDDEHVSADAEWGDLKASDFRDDKELFRVMTTLREGWVSPPFEGDNGVMIVKMLKVIPADPENGRAEALYRMSRIHFELPELWEPETDEEIREDIAKVRGREAFAKGIKELVDASKIEYPCGTNLFPRASSRRRLPPSVRNRLPKGAALPE